MKILKAPEIPKPKFVSEVIVKERPEIKVVSLFGKGDPMISFDKRAAEVISWLKRKGVKSVGPTLGIYYLNRTEVGVENVVWDACVPVAEPIAAESKFKFQVLPSAEMISVVLTGGYDLIGPALTYMNRVTEAREIKTRSPLTEIYLREGEEPITELQYFIVGKKT